MLKARSKRQVPSSQNTYNAITTKASKNVWNQNIYMNKTVPGTALDGHSADLFNMQQSSFDQS